jgi:hypothetical protein
VQPTSGSRSDHRHLKARSVDSRAEQALVEMWLSYGIKPAVLFSESFVFKSG